MTLKSVFECDRTLNLFPKFLVPEEIRPLKKKENAVRLTDLSHFVFSTVEAFELVLICVP